jgi:hypothetical protein
VLYPPLVGGPISQTTLCRAIASRNLVSFYYAGDNAPGPRVVEPYVVAYTTADKLSLSAWFLGGVSESLEGQGWRDYLLESISNVVILSQKFSGPRPGYNPSGGKKFHNIQCRF